MPSFVYKIFDSFILFFFSFDFHLKSWDLISTYIWTHVLIWILDWTLLNDIFRFCCCFRLNCNSYSRFSFPFLVIHLFFCDFLIFTLSFTVQQYFFFLNFAGRPLPNVTWWHETTLLDDTSVVLSGNRVKNVLNLQKIERRQLHMVFTCQASNNQVGSIASSITLDVNCKYKYPYMYKNEIRCLVLLFFFFLHSGFSS